MTTVRLRLLGAAMCALLAASGCAAADTDVVATGRVEVASVLITVPALVAPVFEPDDAGPDTSRGPSSAPALAPAARVAAVDVSLGQRVAPGQVLVRLDTGPLTAQVAVARTDRDAAAAQVNLLSATITDLTANRTTVVEARRKVDDAIATLTSNRRGVVGQLTAARRRLAALPTDPPPQQAPEVARARSRLQAAITQLETALRRLDAGLARARSQRRQLESTRIRLTDAIKQVTDTRELARTAVSASEIALKLAQGYEREATITAPEAGVVTRLPMIGEVLAPGAALLTIARPALRVTTWLAPAKTARLCVGDTAAITADWLPDSRPARVALIGPTAEFPPTHQSTDEVHLTRAIRVEVAADTQLIPGAPVDIRISPCRTS